MKAAADELPPEEPRWVSHAFGFPFNHEGARAAAAELRRRFDDVRVEEEWPGGGCWYVVVRRRQTLLERVVVNAKREMGAVAARHGGNYEGWAAARYGGAWRRRFKT